MVEAQENSKHQETRGQCNGHQRGPCQGKGNGNGYSGVSRSSTHCSPPTTFPHLAVIYSGQEFIGAQGQLRTVISIHTFAGMIQMLKILGGNCRKDAVCYSNVHPQS